MAKIIEENEVASLVEYFAQIPDPRVQGRCEHLLLDVLVMTICSVLCGAQACTDFEDFGHSKEEWLKKFLKLPFGIPSHDTFRRVLSIIDPVQMERMFVQWVQEILGDRKTRSLSIDGKAVGGATHGGIGGRSALHVVNAYAHEHALCLAQVESNGSGGEITAALEVLDILDIKDVLVTTDAHFAVHRIAEKIRAKRDHYLVALKENRRFYREQVEVAFASAKDLSYEARTKEIGHGRREERRACVLYAENENLDAKFFSQWRDLKTLIRVERIRTFEDKRPLLQVKDKKTNAIKYVRNKNQDGSGNKVMRTTHETAYYLTSQKMTAAKALREVRCH